MMKNCDKSVKINHNPNWTYIHHHPYTYRILIIGGLGSAKANASLNLIIKHQILTKSIYIIHSNQFLINGTLFINCSLNRKSKN